MDLFENIPVEIDLQRMLYALGGGSQAVEMKDVALWAIETTSQLVQPKALVGYFDIASRSSETLTLFSENRADAVMLRTGEKGVELLDDACCAQISFVTIGEGLQVVEDDLKNKEDLLRRYFLDVAAVLALEQVGQSVNRMAEIRARQEGWGVGSRISPGDLNSWSIEEQSKLGTLLPIDRIGIQIKPGGMLFPLKSASSLVGMGSSYSEKKVGTICKWCRNQKSCLIRVSENAMRNRQS